MTLEMTSRYPDSERFNAVAASSVFVFGGMAFGFVAAAVLSASDSPLGWLIITMTTVAGLSPIAAWIRRRRNGAVVVAGIPPQWRHHVSEAVASTNRIERAMHALPDGAARDHLRDVLDTAVNHVRAMEAAAQSPWSDEFVIDAPVINRELFALSEAASQLAYTVLPTSPAWFDGPQNLRGLTERTNLLIEALGSLGPDPFSPDSFSAGSDDDDSKPVPDSTNGH